MAKKNGYAAIAVVYLLGLFMGALDMGIVAPARTVIQFDLGVDDQLGIWVVTIYTLAYAAAIPLMGKLADRHGRKPIYLVCVALFGFGSLCCGLAKLVGSFYFLLGARVVQAIGGGGIMPIATAEFGTAFPPEKRGMALGLTGGVFGIANVFGSSIGSLILDIFGQSNWQFIFYLNVPICVFIVIVGIIKLSNNTADEVKPMDILGTVVLVLMVLSLLYGLRMIDFGDLATSVSSTDVWPFLLAFVVLIPIFILVEKRAADPIINLSYFTNRNIVITLIVGMVSGVIMMGAVFIPQFAENSLFMPSGKGGYWVILLGVFAGVGSPMSGTLIDKFGVKPVLGFGLASSAIGALFLALVAAPNPSIVTVAISFILIGLGMGFVMGTPVNYMMMENTKEEEANSALATLSLMRSIGTAVAPAVMVVFLAQAGGLVQERITDVLPSTVEVSQLPYHDEVKAKLEELQNDPDMADMLAESEFPNLDEYLDMDLDMNDKTKNYDVSDEILELMRGSDVTTVVDNTKTSMEALFADIKAQQVPKIQGGIDEGIGHIRSAQEEMGGALDEMNAGVSEMNSGIAGIESGLSQQESARSQLLSVVPMLQKLENYDSVLDLMPDSAKANMPQAAKDQLAGVKTVGDLRTKICELDGAINGMNAQIAQSEQKLADLKAQLADMEKDADSPDKSVDTDKKAQLQKDIEQTQGRIDQMKGAVESQKSAKSMLEGQIPTVEKLTSYNSVLDLMPDSAKNAIPASVRDKLADVKTVGDLNALVSSLDGAMIQMRSARDEMGAGRDELQSAIDEMQGARGDMDTLAMQLGAMRDAVPGLFDEAEENYLASIDDNSDVVQRTFQLTLGEGFAGMFTLVAGISIFGFLLLMLYKGKKREKDAETE